MSHFLNLLLCYKIGYKIGEFLIPIQESEHFCIFLILNASTILALTETNFVQTRDKARHIALRSYLAQVQQYIDGVLQQFHVR